MHSRMKVIALAAGIVGLLAVGVMPVQAAEHERSPALCGDLDTPETGMQGDIPREDQDSGRAAQGYNCGLTLLGELPGGGDVQGAGHCAYVRSSGIIRVIDVSDPENPRQVGTVPTFGGSETFRVVTTEPVLRQPAGGRVRPPQRRPAERAVMVSGAGVYDIRDCENPVLKGQIAWPSTHLFGSGSHDIRVSHDARKVYGAPFLPVADISDLDDPATWTVRDYTCDVAAGEGDLVHSAAGQLGFSLCDYGWGAGPGYTHGPDDNEDGTRLYTGISDVVPDPPGLIGENVLRIIDMTVDPPRVISKIDGPGHSIDWFRTADGREYLLHAAEFGYPGTSCVRHRRPTWVGWANEAFLTAVTGDTLSRASLVELAINKPENCEAHLSSGHHPAVSYHSVDNPYSASFAMVSFGSAGLRVFDIRNPRAPAEVAYFNRGSLVHAGVSHYDAERGLIMVPYGSGLKVLEVQPQIYDALGLPHPTDRAYPRYPVGRPALPQD